MLCAASDWRNKVYIKYVDIDTRADIHSVTDTIQQHKRWPQSLSRALCRQWVELEFNIMRRHNRTVKHRLWRTGTQYKVILRLLAGLEGWYICESAYCETQSPALSPITHGSSSSLPSSLSPLASSALLAQYFILNLRLGSSANPFLRKPFPLLPDWLRGLSDHLTILLYSTAVLVSVLD